MKKDLCELTMVTCIDNRLRAHEIKMLYWLYQRGEWAKNLIKGLSFIEFLYLVVERPDQTHLGYDLISIAGGAGGCPEQLTKNIEISQKLHEPQLWVLCGHYDCGTGVSRPDVLDSVRRLINKQDPIDRVKIFILKPDDKSMTPWDDVTDHL